MSRQVYLAGIALYVLGLAFLLTDELVWSPGVTERNCRRIRPGMTVEQVEAILAGKPREVTQIEKVRLEGKGETLLWQVAYYANMDGTCVVHLNSKDVVQFARWRERGRVNWSYRTYEDPAAVIVYRKPPSRPPGD